MRKVAILSLALSIVLLCTGSVFAFRGLKAVNNTEIHPEGYSIHILENSTKKLSEPIPERNQRFLECIIEVRNWGRELTEREARAMCGYLAGPRITKIPEVSPFIKCLAEKYLENKTFEQAKEECIVLFKKVTCPKVKPPVGKCPGMWVPITKFGCIIGYRCLPIQEVFAKCVKEKVKEGLDKREAIRICSEEYKEQLIGVLSNMSELQLAYHLKCLSVPEDIKEQLKNLIEELRDLKKEKIEKIREIAENCSRYEKGNLTIVQVKYKCGEEIRNVTKKYNTKIKEVIKEIRDLLRDVNVTINVTCLKEKIQILNELTDLEINVTGVEEAANLTPQQKRILIRKVIRKRLRELIRKHPKDAPEFIKELTRREEVKSAILEEIKENPKNPILLRSLLKSKETRREILQMLKKNRELKRELLQNKTLLQEILPPSLKRRLDRLQFEDLNVTEFENRTIMKARVRRRGRLLGIIPITLREEIEFNETAIIRERRPWWAFLVFG